MDVKKFQINQQKFETKYKINGKIEVPIILKKEMVDRYPQGGFQILGDYRNSNDQQIGTIYYDNQEIAVNGYTGDIKNNEYIVGYIPLSEKDCYIRVIKKKRGKLWLILIALALLATIFFGGMWFGQKNAAIDTPVKIKAGSMTNPNPDNIQLPGISKVYAKAGSKRVEQPLLNITGNSVNMVYTITLVETGEEIYKSPTIKPGYGVKQFDMTRTFKKGNYPIAIFVKSFETDKKKNKTIAYNSGQLNATLVVK